MGATREEKSLIINQEQMEYEMSEYDATKQSNIIPDEHLLDRLEEEGKRNKITEWQAGWNITNAIQVSYVYLRRYNLIGFVNVKKRLFYIINNYIFMKYTNYLHININYLKTSL
jgi:hypothetical protein